MGGACTSNINRTLEYIQNRMCNIVLITVVILYADADGSDTTCTEGIVTVTSDSSNNSLKLVEMCSNEGVWSPACDHNWTLEDATVVCRELGYEGLD